MEISENREYGLDHYIGLMERWNDRPFIVGQKGYRSYPWSYREIRTGILCLCSEFEKRGVTNGSRVILAGKQSPEWVVAFFSILHSGAVVVPVDADSQIPFIHHIISRTSPVLIVGDIPALRSQKETAALFLPFSSIRALMNRRDVAHSSSKTNPGDLAEIVFTSGTTSQPKGVMLTHGNILSILKPIKLGIDKHQRLIKILPQLKMLCTLPYSHMYGQVIGIFVPILLGSSVYLTEETSPVSLLRTIRKERIFGLFTVPRVMKLLVDYLKNDLKARGKYERFLKKFERWKETSWQLRVVLFLNLHRTFGLHFWVFIVGGAPIDPETHEFWRRTSFGVIQGYGLTETAPIVTLFNPFQHERDSVGIVFPGQEVKIAPDGEILVKGDNVMTGYFDDPEASGNVLDDGWFRTGDIGEIDSKGHLFIRGRKKEMILGTDGRNIYPIDIERVLNAEEGVRESIVFGEPGPAGESIHAVLLLEPDAEPEKVIQNANTHLGAHEKIRNYSVWEERDFPRTPTMKVKKGDIARKVLEHAQPESEGQGEDLFGGLTAAGAVTKDMRLSSDLGLSSLDIAEVIIRLEKKYGISLDETIINPEITVGEIEELAAKPQKAVSLSMPRWTRKKLVSSLRDFFVNGVLLPSFRTLCTLEVSGREILSGYDGPRILCANHQSDYDSIAVLLALPPRYRRKIASALGLNRFFAYFSKLGTSFVRQDEKRGTIEIAFWMRRVAHIFAYHLVTFLFQVYPFPQGGVYRPSLEYTGELLDAGKWILIFPEGRANRKGEMASFKGGVALLAEKTDVPVFPIGIQGMHSLQPTGRIIPQRGGKVRVAFGEPIRYQGQGHEEFTALVEKAVNELTARDTR